MSLSVTPDPILPELLRVRLARFGDRRGWLSVTFNEAALRSAPGQTDRRLADAPLHVSSAGAGA